VPADAAPAAEALPVSLRQRLDRCADEWLTECAAQRGARDGRSFLHGSTLPWLVATAAMVLAVVGWWPRLAEFQSATAVAGGYEQWRAQRARYQLWVFDAARDDRYPVDGGMFDVPAGRQEVIVPMHLTLPVSRAVAFAITVERPAGAVVSTREKVVAFAQSGS
jgi:hypothetical protein